VDDKFENTEESVGMSRKYKHEVQEIVTTS
jgi:hypothetical protein